MKLKMMIPMNNNTPRICKICHRRFSSGKAMGGHMRSHLAKANPKPNPNPNPNRNPYTNKPDPDSFSSSSYSYHGVHNNNNNHHEVTRSKHYSLVESDFYKRDHILSVEECALILMKMSTDSWTRTTPQNRVPRMVDDMESDEDGDEDGESYGVRARSATRPTTTEIGKYKCLICHKRFTSYQALGGHMASHKKMKGVVIQEEEEDGSYNNTPEPEEQGFKCSYCDKVVTSNEALEVHKKIHYYYDLENLNSTKTTTNNSFDLNRPAVEEDDNDYYYESGSSNYGADRIKYW